MVIIKSAGSLLREISIVNEFKSSLRSLQVPCRLVFTITIQILATY